jgi:hypothetical protein
MGVGEDDDDEGDGDGDGEGDENQSQTRDQATMGAMSQPRAPHGHRPSSAVRTEPLPPSLLHSPPFFCPSQDKDSQQQQHRCTTGKVSNRNAKQCKAQSCSRNRRVDTTPRDCTRQSSIPSAFSPPTAAFVASAPWISSLPLSATCERDDPASESPKGSADPDGNDSSDMYCAFKNGVDEDNDGDLDSEYGAPSQNDRDNVQQTLMRIFARLDRDSIGQ